VYLLPLLVFAVVSVVVLVVVGVVEVEFTLVLFSLVDVASELDDAEFESVELISDGFNSQIEHFLSRRSRRMSLVMMGSMVFTLPNEISGM